MQLLADVELPVAVDINGSEEGHCALFAYSVSKSGDHLLARDAAIAVLVEDCVEVVHGVFTPFHPVPEARFDVDQGVLLFFPKCLHACFGQFLHLPVVEIVQLLSVEEEIPDSIDAEERLYLILRELSEPCEHLLGVVERGSWVVRPALLDECVYQVVALVLED